MQSHKKRPSLKAAFPALITMRAVAQVPTFRCQLLAMAILREIRRASAKGFRIIQFSIQSNHLHLVAEADESVALSRGMQRLSSRIAKHVNLLLGRSGGLWLDRYHRSDLTTPSKLKNGIVYTVFNIRKHSSGVERDRWMHGLDPLSSAIWMNEWRNDRVLEVAKAARSRAGPCPIATATTWLARVGWWKHRGLLDGTECPKRTRPGRPAQPNRVGG